MAEFMKPHREGISLLLHVQPKASRNEVAGIHGGALKVRIKAPPVDGAANEACLKFMATFLGMPPSALTLLSGHSGRQKKILVTRPPDCSPETFFRKIQELFRNIPK
ncbi:DUF167 domain-containing protein [Desulfobotulus sp. H1]|uniref:UPF0235 protein OOT00_06430 n=1 Tax=Desulfobotulus pelophilus TaxID=2823377 RepID=A0ABT3N841_9BACT|nr:DUF167 domain-containing protein [Desulfobotulus pelophilus]MCW7753620.1 DUF167 domain-containing protein [Desulfobotulus pelophilus]